MVNTFLIFSKVGFYGNWNNKMFFQSKHLQEFQVILRVRSCGIRELLGLVTFLTDLPFNKPFLPFRYLMDCTYGKVLS